jgi:membrane protein DedA with SNARE-associated domain/rhodanese-related sulfurtransferase
MPDVLVQYGVVVLFAWALGVQAGVPAPAVPILVGAGVLCGSGQMNLVLAIVAATAATIAADALWYTLGRAYGTRVLATLLRFSLDRDSLIREAKERFAAHRARYLILAKFLPGVNPLAAGLAGAVPIPIGRFVRYAAAGAVLWATVWITLGYLCADVIDLVLARAARVKVPLIAVIAVALFVYLVVKYARRQYFLRHLLKARISAPELKRRLEAGDPLVIVDLRTALDREAAPYGIPGAQWFAPETLRHSLHLIPRGSELVVYCEEPREATSALTALRLSSHGFKDIHPLSGGLEGWRQAGFVVEPLARVPSSQPAQRTVDDGELGQAHETPR